MNEDHKKIITQTIKDSFTLKDKYYDHELNHSFQLLLSQLDLFKTMATIAITVVSIGYFFSDNFHSVFLLISGIFSGLALLGTISYTREIINLEAKQIKEVGDKFKQEVDSIIDVAVESIQKNNSSIYFDYAKSKISDKVEKPVVLLYADEIFTFLLYNSIFFLILAFFVDIYNFNLMCFLIIPLLFTSYILSFKNWSSYLIKNISEKIQKYEK